MQGTGLKVREAGRLCFFGQLGLFIPPQTCKIVTQSTLGEIFIRAFRTKLTDSREKRERNLT